VINHDKIFCKEFRGTCSSVEILKGYMVRERLGTPVIEDSQKNAEIMRRHEAHGRF